ncbi:MAG: NADH-quinone oxidoreductase subunit A [Chloroflexota bacterium]|nr:NADH-quinone oxidoreductase subunit A [Chloroflexota bacterium]
MLKDVGTAAVVELIIFVGVLGAALAYIWRKGALEWR